MPFVFVLWAKIQMPTHSSLSHVETGWLSYLQEGGYEQILLQHSGPWWLCWILSRQTAQYFREPILKLRLDPLSHNFRASGHQMWTKTREHPTDNLWWLGQYPVYNKVTSVTIFSDKYEDKVCKAELNNF